MSKIPFFCNMMFCWFMFWSGSRYTAGLPAISEGIVSLFSDNPRSENLSIIPDHFFFSLQKDLSLSFNYSTVWSSLIICSRLANARDSLKFNIHIGKLRMRVMSYHLGCRTGLQIFLLTGSNEWNSPTIATRIGDLSGQVSRREPNWGPGSSW